MMYLPVPMRQAKHASRRVSSNWVFGTAAVRLIEFSHLSHYLLGMLFVEMPIWEAATRLVIAASPFC
jgi:hypothetical protein